VLALGLAPGAHAQDVLLQIRPHVGDTVHMRLDQESELTRIHARADAPRPASVITDLSMFSRAIVRGTSRADATVLAITDSVAMSTTDPQGRAVADATRRMLVGRQVMLRIADDGTVTMLRANVPSGERMADVVALMPAALPATAVRVGDHWTREMPLPSEHPFHGHAAGHLDAVFRLDSLSRDGAMAYISVRGTLHSNSAATPVAGSFVQDGTVTGTMRLDRRRGWLADTRFVIVVRSTMSPPAGSGRAPMQFRIAITQRTRTCDRR
jgi:hypothetical protein